MKQDYCQLLVSKQTAGNRIPILCNQEHFILRGNSYKINQSLPGFYCIINPAIKETHDKGRAKNGMFIAGYWRLQAMILKTKFKTTYHKFLFSN